MRGCVCLNELVDVVGAFFVCGSGYVEEFVDAAFDLCLGRGAQLVHGT